jgi:F1F0 ATPase subunit 2
MNDPLMLAVSLVAGFASGCMFFGALWWTVRRGVAARVPALWFLVSFAVRTGIVLSAFYFVSQGDGGRLMACLVGFVMARFLVIRVTQPSGLEPGGPTERSRHASES